MIWRAAAAFALYAAALVFPYGLSLVALQLMATSGSQTEGWSDVGFAAEFALYVLCFLALAVWAWRDPTRLPRSSPSIRIAAISAMSVIHIAVGVCLFAIAALFSFGPMQD
ncbi:MAG: hypothetical protein JF570_03985 [Caulobacter sp.]|nr:hypothetical protein [Caulobacter sp.]